MLSKYAGKDNYGRPKADYLAKIAGMSEPELEDECYRMIYQSSLCNNNYKADWHWMVDACYEECVKRDPQASIYTRAYNLCVKEHAR
jgi:tRNA A37 threonylcarbamoyladenosine dehydratase